MEGRIIAYWSGIIRRLLFRDGREGMDFHGIILDIHNRIGGLTKRNMGMSRRKKRTAI